LQFKTPIQVLDLGSATGGNTLHIQSMGHKVTSAEYSEIGAAIQRSKGIFVIQCDARNLPFDTSCFDSVVCLDVLEHIVEDELATREIFRVLKPGGSFLISVPEDPKLWSAHDVSVNHVRRYSKDVLVNLILESGLTVREVWSTLVYLRPAIVFARKFSRVSDLRKMNVIVNQILFLLCKIEVILPRNHRKGVTLWIEGVK
jgi:SAM-dependent methyltransferase